MDKITLVKSDRDIGARVMEALSRVSIPVTLCEWNYVPQLEEWQLVIATPWYDSKGPRTTYASVVNALQKAGIYKRVPMRRVFVRSPEDEIVKALQQEAREQRQGFVHLLRHPGPNNGKRYSLIFAPITGRGGPVPARRFSRLEDLREFLAEDLHLRSSSIEEALDEMARSGASSISPVSLTARTIKKLGLG